MHEHKIIPFKPRRKPAKAGRSPDADPRRKLADDILDAYFEKKKAAEQTASPKEHTAYYLTTAAAFAILGGWGLLILYHLAQGL